MDNNPRWLSIQALPSHVSLSSYKGATVVVLQVEDRLCLQGELSFTQSESTCSLLEAMARTLGVLVKIFPDKHRSDLISQQGTPRTPPQYERDPGGAQLLFSTIVITGKTVINLS
jgi:hypothetical protein